MPLWSCFKLVLLSCCPLYISFRNHWQWRRSVTVGGVGLVSGKRYTSSGRWGLLCSIARGGMEEPSRQQLETKYIRTLTEAPFIGPVGYHKPRYIHSPYAGSKQQISYPVSVSRNNLLSTPWAHQYLPQKTIRIRVRKRLPSSSCVKLLHRETSFNQYRVYVNKSIMPRCHSGLSE